MNSKSGAMLARENGVFSVFEASINIDKKCDMCSQLGSNFSGSMSLRSCWGVQLFDFLLDNLFAEVELRKWINHPMKRIGDGKFIHEW